MSPYQSRCRPDDAQLSRSPYQESYHWMVKPFLFMLLFASVGVLLSECRTIWVGIPREAESALYAQVICVNPERRCRGITILEVHPMRTGWCVVYGGNRWNSRTTTDEQFKRTAVIYADEQGGYSAQPRRRECQGD